MLVKKANWLALLNGPQFSLTAGCFCWFALEVISAVKDINANGATWVTIISSIIILAFGLPGGFANVWWSKKQHNNEPVTQLVIVIGLFVALVLPEVSSSYNPTTLTFEDLAGFILLNFSVVGMRILWALLRSIP